MLKLNRSHGLYALALLFLWALLAPHAEARPSVRRAAPPPRPQAPAPRPQAPRPAVHRPVSPAKAPAVTPKTKLHQERAQLQEKVKGALAAKKLPSGMLAAGINEKELKASITRFLSERQQKLAAATAKFDELVARAKSEHQDLLDMLSARTMKIGYHGGSQRGEIRPAILRGKAGHVAPAGLSSLYALDFDITSFCGGLPTNVLFITDGSTDKPTGVFVPGGTWFGNGKDSQAPHIAANQYAYLPPTQPGEQTYSIFPLFDQHLISAALIIGYAGLSTAGPEYDYHWADTLDSNLCAIESAWPMIAQYFHLNPKKFFAAGISAGGHIVDDLASLYGVLTHVGAVASIEGVDNLVTFYGQISQLGPQVDDALTREFGNQMGLAVASPAYMRMFFGRGAPYNITVIGSNGGNNLQDPYASNLCADGDGTVPTNQAESMHEGTGNPGPFIIQLGQMLVLKGNGGLNLIDGEVHYTFNWDNDQTSFAKFFKDIDWSKL